MTKKLVVKLSGAEVDIFGDKYPADEVSIAIGTGRRAIVRVVTDGIVIEPIAGYLLSEEEFANYLSLRNMRNL